MSGVLDSVTGTEGWKDDGVDTERVMRARAGYALSGEAADDFGRDMFAQWVLDLLDIIAGQKASLAVASADMEVVRVAVGDVAFTQALGTAEVPGPVLGPAVGPSS